MTISYTTQNTKGGFFPLLFRWHGSIWKLLWEKLLIFSILYIAIALVYRLALKEEKQRQFERVAEYFDEATERIPITFILGFYVTQMVTRWWNQFNGMVWPDRFMYFASSFIAGDDEYQRKVRRTLARYITLMQALAYRGISARTLKRFPTIDHVVASGLMTESEKKAYDEVDGTYGKWFVPAVWAQNLLTQLKQREIIDGAALNRFIMELDTMRGNLGGLMAYDWISVPLVYTQVATIATYGYFAFCLIGRQCHIQTNLTNGTDTVTDLTKETVDLYVPILAILEFLFYMGWLSVAEELCNPFGEDDEDFETSYVLDRNHHVAFLIGDTLHGQIGEVDMDKFWGNTKPKLPHTFASWKVVGHDAPDHLAVLAGHLSGTEKQFVPDNENIDLRRSGGLGVGGAVWNSIHRRGDRSSKSNVVEEQALHKV